jgi:hypothetical protein
MIVAPADQHLSFVVSFTLPYLLDKPGANLQSKVGFIYGSICFLGLTWGFFFLPGKLRSSANDILRDRR